jgi:uroporphyrinogen-III decarboxylase
MFSYNVLTFMHTFTIVPQVNIADGWRRIQDTLHPANNVKAVQGNLDPMILHGSKELIRQRTEEILSAMSGG